jgi:acyl transferase domain-containing protein
MSPRDPKERPEVRIAVVGLDCIFPQAPDARTFWANIVNALNAIGDPLPAWNSEVHLHRRGDTSTDQGGYLRELFCVDPAKFGIMPRALDGGEPDQFIALELARRALLDAGAHYLDPKFDHRDTGVIIGHSPYYHRGQVNTAQHHVFIEQMREIVLALKPDLTHAQLDRFETLLRDQLPPFVADISPGLVPNVLTGRIANRLNLRGPNYMIDAACASSLIAVQAAVDELMRGNSRMMLVGGVNASLPAEVAIIFTQLSALSTSGRVRPFSSTADGTLLGEGAGVVVLKRLEDALGDGDRIYSVIRGVGQSSDGRGLGLLSPSQDGEVLAMRRAYDFGGIDARSVSLIECHGTGIPLGDRTEIAALTEVFGTRDGPDGEIAIGSVKSMISHTIPAAGIAGLIKTSMALHHRLLPPTLCDEVKEDLGIQGTRLYINSAPRPWIHSKESPRRAGVNAFGFGGVNAHVVLEEAPAEAARPPACTPWSHELFTLAGAELREIDAQLDRLDAFAQTENGASLGAMAYACWQDTGAKCGPLRLTIVAADRLDLLKKIAQARKKLAEGRPFTTRTGLCFRTAPLEGKLAFMFAGEGSQHLRMFEDLACRFEDVRRWLDFWKDSVRGTNERDRCDVFYPAASELTEARRSELTEVAMSMAVGSEAAFVGGQAMFDLLTGLGVRPDAVVGHSTGESGALVAARVVRATCPEDVLAGFREITAISREIQESGHVPTGALLAVGLLPRDRVTEVLQGTEALVAMDNCPNQIVVFAPPHDAERAMEALTSVGGVVELLPFDRGYHTPGFRRMQEAFEAFYTKVGVNAPEVPLWSCATAATFPPDPATIVGLAGRQWSQTVRFVDTVKAMYADGVRAFIEVAPGGKLSSFVQQTLAATAPGADLLIAPCNLENRPDLEVLLHLMGQLYAHGLLDPDRVFAGRALDMIDLSDPQPKKRRGIQIDNSIPRIHATPDLVAHMRAMGLGAAVPVPLQDAGTQSLTPSAPSIFAHSATASAVRPRPLAQDLETSPVASIFTTGLGLVTEAMQRDPDTVGAEVTCAISTTGFLQDHVLSGKVSEDPGLFGMSCVPFMVSLEIMAEAAAALLGRTDLGLVENMTGEGWIWADADTTSLRVIARRTGRASAATEIWSAGVRAVSAQLTFGPTNPQDTALKPVQPGHSYTWSEPFEMYRENIFHGPLFQTIDSVLSWGPDGIEATLSDVRLEGFVEPGKVPAFILNPSLFDAFTQITAFWLAEERGQYFASFPRKIDRIELYNPPPGAADGLWLRAARVGTPKPGGDGTWAIDCYQNDRPVVRVRGMENAYCDLPEPYYLYSLEPINGWLGYPIHVSEGIGQVVWHMPALEPDFWRKIGGVFHRVLAYSSLGAAERVIWHGLAHDPDAREAWLIPRVAMKEAVRYWVNAYAGLRLYSADIELHDAGSGTWLAHGTVDGHVLSMRVATAPSGVTVSVVHLSFATLEFESKLEQYG